MTETRATYDVGCSDGLKTCEWCGKPVEKDGHRFCSISCRNAHNASKQVRKGEVRTCSGCGAEFYVSPSDMGRRAALYCSYECAGIARRGESSANYKGMVHRICQHCGKEFETYQARVQQGRAKYCSQDCASSAHKVARVNIPCDNCGEMLELIYARFNASERHYCSNECYSASKQKSDEERQTTIDAVCGNCGKEFWALKYDQSKSGHRFCSATCFGAWRARNASVGYSSARGGKRSDLGGLYVRSSWEANWARYLNWLQEHGEIESWEYEPDTFWFDGVKRGTRSYTPDFKVHYPDGSVVYHEVKGYMDQRSATKLKRMAKYHPDVRVILIDSQAYYSVASSVAGIVANWETRHAG